MQSALAPRKDVVPICARSVSRPSSSTSTARWSTATRAIAASVNHLRQRHGQAPLPVDLVRRCVGRGPEFLLRSTVPGVDWPADWAAYQRHHPTVMRPLTRLLPGAARVLAALCSRGLTLGICSNKPRIFTQELLDHLKLADLFAVVVGPEDVPRPKPAPDMLRAALGRLDLTAAEALYVGDMRVDIETARAAGVAVWVVPTGSDDRASLEAAKPDRLLESLSQLLEE